ncbi:MAG: hypothetical protein M0T84_12555, partial [Betaproteobacteria bacterium]|nr:hypothetical protein [Betaproteobacteria bacterium]
MAVALALSALIHLAILTDPHFAWRARARPVRPSRLTALLAFRAPPPKPPRPRALPAAHRHRPAPQTRAQRTPAPVHRRHPAHSRKSRSPRRPRATPARRTRPVPVAQ